MLRRSDGEDSWIWITIERGFSASQLEEAIAFHEEDMRDLATGTFHDKGYVETEKFGTAGWSWGTYAAEEGEENDTTELALFVPYPSGNGLLGMRYVITVEVEDVEARVAEVVAVAEGLSER